LQDRQHSKFPTCCRWGGCLCPIHVEIFLQICTRKFWKLVEIRVVEYAKVVTEQDLYLNCSVSWHWTKPAANKQQ